MKKYPTGSTIQRALEVLRLLIDEPEVYTKRALAEKYNVDIDTIKSYFKFMRNAGFSVKHNDYPDYQYYVEGYVKRK